MVNAPVKKKKETITVQQYKALKKQPKRSNKFGNKIIKTPEGVFASTWEHEYWGILKILVRAGKIKNLKKQIKYPLRVNGVHITDYIADFVYEDKSGKTVVVDTKSKATAKLPEFQMKKKLMMALFGIDVKVVFKKI